MLTLSVVSPCKNDCSKFPDSFAVEPCILSIRTFCTMTYEQTMQHMSLIRVSHQKSIMVGNVQVTVSSLSLPRGSLPILQACALLRPCGHHLWNGILQRGSTAAHVPAVSRDCASKLCSRTLRKTLCSSLCTRRAQPTACCARRCR